MIPLGLLAIAVALCLLGALSALVVADHRVPIVLGLAGSLASIAITAAGGLLLAGSAVGLDWPLWRYPGLGAIAVHADRLSGFFLAITGCVCLPGIWSAASQLGARRRPGRRGFALCLLLLVAALAAILVAGDVVSFFLAWEAMALLAYLLIQQPRPSRRAGHAAYLWLALSEAGVLIALVGFGLLASHTGSLAFVPLAAAAPRGVRAAIFLLALFGFGVKAGLVPLNVWLPRVYTEAPSAFAPILAGATLNLGFYGILRLLALAGNPGAVAGGVALVIGTLSALIGILYASIARDMRTVLAHSSIENAGVAIAAIGAAIVFQSAGLSAPAAIALAAGLYHLAGHSLVKTLLFAGVAGVEQTSGSRDLDRLGGLAKAMPLASVPMLIGCLSLAALPPLSGFVSEWLTYQSLLRSAELANLGLRLLLAVCGAGLALSAGLAVTCFVKFFAMAFLGKPRTVACARAKEPTRGTLAAMALLAAGVVALGVLPTYVLAALSPIGEAMLGGSATEALVPPFFEPSSGQPPLPSAFVADFHRLGAQLGQGLLPGRGLVVMLRGGSANPVVFAMSTTYLLAALGLGLLATFLVVRLVWAPRRQVQRAAPWDGGLPKLSPVLTYTATGFSNPVRVVFEAVFRPTTVEETLEDFQGAGPPPREKHLVDRLVFGPALSACRGVAAALARMHHGRLGAYAAYGLALLLAVLALTTALGGGH